MATITTKPTPNQAAGSSSTLAETNAEAAANAAELALNAAEASLSKPRTNWIYSESVDKVRGATTHFASTTSTNSVHQDAPYDSATTMDMTVRKSKAYGTDVMLSISSGQLMCSSYDGCSGTVSFDGGPAQRIGFNGAADNSSDTIFVIGANSFIGKLRKAKKVVIEKTLYEAGNPQFEFDVAGLEWKH